ncbi:MAG: 3-keto-5-aminohexanoate cleavage protein [Myxococcus sp.]|nr:3-keto-5-aminohexanoate cleavage protein [Myxococcus sp.]
MNPMVITAAMVGAEVTREQTPYLPITADEIAEDAARCREAGAAMVHLHVRNPDGTPSQDAELFRAAIRAIRRKCDVLVQVSTGGAVGMGVDERCGALTLLGADRPDMATLTTGTVNFGPDVFSNPRPLVREIATRIKARNLRPEIECFDVGMIDEARALAKEGFIELPAHFDFVLGVGGALAADVRALDFMRSYIPEGSTWTCAAMGRHQLPFVELVAERGGNSRVGMEDNIYLSRGVLAKGNYELVAEAAKLAKAKGRALASPVQARELLKLT